MVETLPVAVHKSSASFDVPTLDPVARAPACSNDGLSVPDQDIELGRPTDRSRRRHDGTARLGADAIDPVTRRGIGVFLPLLLDVALPNITRVVLYGSRARGDYHDESDVDIAVVLEGHRPQSEGDIALRLSRKLTQPILECRLRAQVDVSPMLVWEGELVNPEATADPGFFRNVLADSLEIYAS